MKRKLSNKVASAATLALQCVSPLLPLVAAILFWKKDYVLNYPQAWRKIKIHIRAVSAGPLQHYVQTNLFFNDQASEPILGHCSQCGNCCLNQQCFFLEPSGPEVYVCGIYKSALRRFSNCSSFPINSQDIERYQCPTYRVVRLHRVNEVIG